MNMKRKIEIFSAGCPACDQVITLVNENACPSCEIEILDVKDQAISQRVKELGILSIPAVAIDGKLVECCKDKGGPDLAKLKAAGLGQAK